MSCKVEIYTRALCPYCQRAKDLLRIKGVPFVEHNLTSGPPLLDAAGAVAFDTVPKIFINRRMIGGCAELFALDEKGELDNLLKLPVPAAGLPR